MESHSAPDSGPVVRCAGSIGSPLRHASSGPRDDPGDPEPVRPGPGGHAPTGGVRQPGIPLCERSIGSSSRRHASSEAGRPSRSSRGCQPRAVRLTGLLKKSWRLRSASAGPFAAYILESSVNAGYDYVSIPFCGRARKSFQPPGPRSPRLLHQPGNGRKETAGSKCFRLFG